MAAGLYYFSVYFNIEDVSKGNMPFKYEDLKAFTNNKMVLVSVVIVGVNIVILSQMAGIIRYLTQNDSFCSTLLISIRYLIMLLVCYAIVLAQGYNFMLGIEVEPKGLPFFQHELAKSTAMYMQSFHIAN
jgi:hypothetical protein